ncbi:MAG: hypothetical protein QOD31_3234 [Pseudonocardiales bacterium]|nr:hypothetical protein [Pseudonocardiales bacterium]
MRLGSSGRDRDAANACAQQSASDGQGDQPRTTAKGDEFAHASAHASRVDQYSDYAVIETWWLVRSWPDRCGASVSVG